MNDKRIRSLEDVRAFLAGSTTMEFSITEQDERYRWIEQPLQRFHYRTLGRSERGVVLRYLQRVSCYSRQTLTRLVAQYQPSGELRRRQRTVPGFQRNHTLKMPDCWMSCMAGAAAKKLCERMYRVHGDARFESLSHISVSLLDNLRRAAGYPRQRRHFEKTRLTRAQIAQRRKPDPRVGTPAIRASIPSIRAIWTASRGYHINAVDEVTQFRCVFSVQRIGERFLSRRGRKLNRERELLY